MVTENNKACVDSQNLFYEDDDMSLEQQVEQLEADENTTIKNNKEDLDQLEDLEILRATSDEMKDSLMDDFTVKKFFKCLSITRALIKKEKEYKKSQLNKNLD